MYHDENTDPRPKHFRITNQPALLPVLHRGSFAAYARPPVATSTTLSANLSDAWMILIFAFVLMLSLYTSRPSRFFLLFMLYIIESIELP
jgi:hypothetical protein